MMKQEQNIRNILQTFSMSIFSKSESIVASYPIEDFDVNKFDYYLKNDFYNLLRVVNEQWHTDSEYMCVCLRDYLIRVSEKITYKDYLAFKGPVKVEKTWYWQINSLVESEKSEIWECYIDSLYAQLDDMDTLLKLAIHFKARSLSHFKEKLKKWLFDGFEKLIFSVLHSVNCLKNKHVLRYINKEIIKTAIKDVMGAIKYRNFKVEINDDLVKAILIRRVFEKSNCGISNMDEEMYQFVKEELLNFKCIALKDEEFKDQFAFLNEFYQEFINNYEISGLKQKVDEYSRILEENERKRIDEENASQIFGFKIENPELFDRIYEKLKDHNYLNVSLREWHSLERKKAKENVKIDWISQEPKHKDFYEFLVIIEDFTGTMKHHHFSKVVKERFSINDKPIEKTGIQEVENDISDKKRKAKERILKNRSKLFNRLHLTIKKNIEKTYKDVF